VRFSGFVLLTSFSLVSFLLDYCGRRKLSVVELLYGKRDGGRFWGKGCRESGKMLVFLFLFSRVSYCLLLPIVKPLCFNLFSDFMLLLRK
jgi:hypothetical protein